MSAPEEMGADKPFDEPWQAQVFALTVALNEAGWLDWPDWATAFGQERAGEGDYFQDWLDTLQRLLAERGVADAQTITALTATWQRAARATPHGTPIDLANDPHRHG